VKEEAMLAHVGPWLRWSPALCAAIMATGTILASPLMLWTVAAIALLGAALPFHPFDLLYDHGVRHLTGTRPLPHHGAQRRFACAVAAAWLVATGLAFHAGSPLLGYVLGGAMTAAAVTVATTHLCFASAVYNRVFRPRVAVAAPAARRA
jgi:hypothetical protein